MKLFKETKWSNFFGLSNSEEEMYNIEESEVELDNFTDKTRQEHSYYHQPSTKEIDDDIPVQPSSNQYTNKKVVEMNAYQSVPERTKQVENKRVSRKITVFEPRAYSDSKSIAQALFRKEIVILTFSAMEEFQARRVVDFVTGAVFALDGDIQRIGEEIFICTPANVEVDSSVAQSLVATHLADY